MPKFQDIVRQHATTQEISKATLAMFQQLLVQGNQFDLHQDVQVSKGYSCKPLHLLLTIEHEELADSIRRSLTQLFANDALSHAIMTYKDSLNYALSDYTRPTQEEVKSAGKLGVFAHPQPDAKKMPRPAATGLLEISTTPWGGKGIAVKPDQLKSILENDEACSSLGPHVKINKPIEIGSLEALQSVALQQKMQFDQEKTLTTTFLPVFIPSMGYEILLSTIKRENGSLCMIVSDIMGKEALLKSKNIDIERMIHVDEVTCIQNQASIHTQYKDSPVSSCCGAMIHLVFSAADKALENEVKLDASSLIELLTKTTNIDITETIERANTALRASLSPPPSCSA